MGTWPKVQYPLLKGAPQTMTQTNEGPPCARLNLRDPCMARAPSTPRSTNMTYLQKFSKKNSVLAKCTFSMCNSLQKSFFRGDSGIANSIQNYKKYLSRKYVRTNSLLWGVRLLSVTVGSNFLGAGGVFAYDLPRLSL